MWSFRRRSHHHHRWTGWHSHVMYSGGTQDGVDSGLLDRGLTRQVFEDL